MKWPTFTDPAPNETYNFTAKVQDMRPLRVLIVIGLLFMAAFVWVYFQPANQGNAWLFGLLTVSVIFKLLRLLHEWYHYWNVRPSTPPRVSRVWTVDVLTTYCPGEPYEMVLNTLQAIQAMPYPHTTFLCDEADDPYLRQQCAALGVRHVTRTSRKDAKAGNINNALQQATGEICLVLDPDHVPVPNFLDQVLPYFEDASIGFVQCVQGYYNRKESVVAFGAAEQTYSFYGPMMTCMGNYGTAQAIGANCTFRRAALDSIGGHANGLSEDMHTAMRLHAKGWKSVYVPLPLSYGLVPATLSAYYKQQLKWARGTFELLFITFPKVFRGLSGRQRLHYGTLPIYYLLGVVQLIDLLIPICSLVQMQLPLYLDLPLFATVYLPLLATGFLIRQYAQRWLIERHEPGFHLVGGLLASGTWWVYVLGFIYTLLRVKVPYIPTPKDDKPRNNMILVLPNLLMCLASVVAIGYSTYEFGRFAHDNIYSRMLIGFALLNAAIMGINVLIGQEKLLVWISVRIRGLARRKSAVWSVRIMAWKARYGLYSWLRLSAIPLFGVVLLLATGMTIYTYQEHAGLPRHIRHANTQPFYVGAEPSVTLAAPSRIANPDHRLVVQHIGWPVGSSSPIQPILPESANQIPLLYLEPMPGQTHPQKAMLAFIQAMLAGKYNPVLEQFARTLNTYKHPVLVSFMPEFDDPAHPWGSEHEPTLRLYRQAWQYLVHFCQQRGTENVAWIWCPSRPSSITDHFPGNPYVDWLGLPILDDPAEAPDERGWSFASLYQIPRNTVRLHKSYSIRQKPILITHFGSVSGRLQPASWIQDGLTIIQERYPEVRGVVFDYPSPLLTKVMDNLPRN
ncbi:glycosyltransferase [Spirosoma taeanense]|uniref:Glycosyltransferase n=1 Tax=Spirosoma taeanense TaxID=2735870 RepID=A0A6M5YC29_9BACT|nr:glycosyltransferase family 2 protein [Spirosoma taeanense]QJW90811.1 glycosyltransferase [Spirosoma taeanense]